MPSVREQILQHLRSVADAVFPTVNVKRSRTLPVSKAEQLGISMYAESESVEDMPSNRSRRTLTVTFKLFVRGNAPDELADPHVTALTAAVLSDIRCGGFATQIQETGTTWDYDTDVSEDYGEVTVSFLITYDTQRANQTIAA